MPKGVTQDQVNAAIDALVAVGERPTIERVRSRLGTGSPNTLTRMLDAWWAQLHERLTQQRAKLAIPEAPEEVAVAATRLWQLALEQADTRSQAATEALREALVQGQASLAAERAGWQRRLEEAVDKVTAAHREQVAAESRLADLQRLLDQQTGQLADLKARCAVATAQAEDLVSHLAASQQTLLAVRAEATVERGTLEASHRTAEDRWMKEVDRARQDAADSAKRLRELEASTKATSQQIVKERAEVLGQLRRTEQDLARKDARVGALEEQIERLHQQLKATLSGAKSKSAVGRSRMTRALKLKGARS